ncbi:cAMP dependent protein kinase [Lentinula raphanica]|uniref:cAMP-dependent protein kinase n=1 Tax=Lentinula raphanica TaxID=153919 RepID=A0AA38PID5_9AGAR|nr:cAMP dependent protein kinase [Lentinula raphanica]KAJ3976398.1 cAMP dependent protein kinase [Lentinula raphanica]
MPSSYLAPRSGSIPEHIQLPQSLPASRNPSFDSASAQGPSLSRRESHSAVPDTPITPPLSPGQSADISMEDDGDVEDLDMSIDEVESGASGGGMETVVDSLNLSPPPAASMEPRRSREAIDISRVREAQALSRPIGGPEGHRPLRLLEDEEVHLQKSGIKLTDFEVRGTLGSGTFARVLLVRHRSSSNDSSAQNHYALKVLRKTEIVRLRQVEHVNAERYILSRVHHPFIVDLFATFQDSLNVYMLMSYIPGGELFTHLRRAQRFTPDVTRFYLATIILALKYLHSYNIIYRDLKPENLLLDSRGYLRLTDFGFAKIVDDRTWTLCGTPEYLAPEIIQSDGHGKAADWWACGVLCYEMLVGYPPFYDESPYGIYEKILNGHIHWPRGMDPLSRSLVRAFLNPDRTQRLGNMIGGPQDILEHPWFRGVDWDALERREITAPIIPHTSSSDDTRHFLHLPFPPAAEIPGLIKEEAPSPVQRFDPIACQFLEF